MSRWEHLAGRFIILECKMALRPEKIPVSLSAASISARARPLNVRCVVLALLAEGLRLARTKNETN